MVAIRDARVLVTGGTGFIGSHLAHRLVTEGADVHVLNADVSAVFPRRLLDLKRHIALHDGNVGDRSAMDAVVKEVRPQVVFHLAAYTHVGKSWQRVDECVQTNVQGTINLLLALDAVGYERFVFMGTSEIYGSVEVPFREDALVDPGSPYSVSKYAAERYCRMFHRGYSWPIVMVRPFNAYGPAQSPDRIVPEVIVRALRGQELQMTTGRQTREFNYVEDLADGLIQAGSVSGIEGELFNIGCGEETAVRDIVASILEQMGNPIEPKIGVLPDRPNEIWRMYSDSTKARDRLGWSPKHSLHEGLSKTIDWYRTELEADVSSFEV